MGEDNDSVPLSSKLWPLVLYNSPRAFHCIYFYWILELKKTEAIYQLLVEGRDSFLEILMNRERTVLAERS